MSNISDFKANFGGGSRANLFKAIVNFPGDNKSLTELSSFMIKGASLPASVIANIDVPYRGRQIKVAGDRTFEPMTFTVINDGNMVIRNEFEKWMNAISAHEGNTSAYSTTGNPLAYYADVEIYQLDRSGSEVPTKAYKLIDAYPTNVSAIELSYDANDAVEEFTVEMSFQYWTSNTTS